MSNVTERAKVLLKLNNLVYRAKGYTATPGPAGEVQQTASGIINNHYVRVVVRDGAIQHWEVQKPATLEFSTWKTHREVLDLIEPITNA